MIPSPPTDNLYKFMALSGVLLTIISLIVPFNFRSRVLDQWVEVNMEAAALTAEAQVDGEWANRLSAAWKEVEAGTASREAPESITGLIVEDEARRGGPIAVDKEIAARSARLDLTLKRIRQLNSDAKVLGAVGIGGAVAGLILGYVGFTLWYRRVQVHIDRATAAGTPESEESVQGKN